MAKNALPTSLNHPISTTWVIRILLTIVIVLSLAAGFYQLKFSQERKRYLYLEDRYVRVREEVGVEEMQRLIDQSYQDL